MATIKTGLDLALALCKPLGLDPKSEITSITIVARVGDVAKVTVERLVLTDAAEKISRVLDEYELALKPKDDARAWREQCAAGAVASGLSDIVPQPDPRNVS